LCEKTSRALEQAIRKWEAIVAGSGRDLGPENCALCQLFYYKNCVGCPVYQSTGLRYCAGSPYEEWSYYGYRSATDGGDIVPYELAKKELEFLKSLRNPVTDFSKGVPHT